MTQYFSAKEPAETYAIGFDFTDDLGTEGIASAVITATDQSDGTDQSLVVLNVALQSILGKIVYTWVRAGTANHTYLITCTITGNSGSVYELSGLLPVIGSTGVPNNLNDLILKARSRLDDETVPYLWTDANLVSGAQYAVNRMCEECKFLVDSATVDITEITLVTATALYALDPRIIEVLEVYPNWSNLPLTKTEVADMTKHTGWRTVTGTPRGYLLDFQIDYLRTYPIPELADNGYKLNMNVVRYPLQYFSAVNMIAQTLEIPARYQEDLINGIMSQAYLKKDSETFNEKLATYHLGMFEKRMSEVARKIHNKTKSAQTASPLGAFI